MSESPIVTVEQGQLLGKVVGSPSGKSFFSFQGIPYAKPPLGSLRFQDPQPLEPWEGVREATAEGSDAVHFDIFLTKTFVGDENCLYLNVYTPNLEGSFLPVMFFIHGGGFGSGSGSSKLYGGDYLVEKDVVVVTVNYRLGPLGFLSLNTPEVPGNAGLKDIVQALRWVKANIEQFGGNPANVTIFGESAGSMAVCMLTASPMSKTLFSKAIVQSAAEMTKSLVNRNPVNMANEIAKKVGFESGSEDELLEYLRTTSASELMAAALPSMDNFSIKSFDFAFVPIVEKEFPGVEAFLPEPFIDYLTSGRIAHVPVMVGICERESLPNSVTSDLETYIPDELNIDEESKTAIVAKIRQLYMENGEDWSDDKKLGYLFGDAMLVVDVYRYVKNLVKVTNSPIYFYLFDYFGELNIGHKMFGIDDNVALHMDELGYLFKNVLQEGVEPTPQDVKVRERMLRLWTDFAKCGNPTPHENHYINVTWQPITKDVVKYLHITSQLSMAENPRQKYMDFWQSLYDKYYKSWEHLYIPEPTQTFAKVVDESPKIVEDIVKVSDNTEAVIVEDSETVNVVEDLSSVTIVESSPVETVEVVEEVVVEAPAPVEPEVAPVEPEVAPVAPEVPPVVTATKVVEETPKVEKPLNGYSNGVTHKVSEVKVNGAPKDIIRANDPQEDDLPKNIGVNKFVNFFESLGGKK